MQGEQIRERLHSGQRIYGTHVCGLSNAVGVQITAIAPLDFVFICAEHMPMDRGELSVLCQLFAGKGISPIVRIPYPCARQAAMALDGGAQGIVAPYVETVEDVRQVTSAVHYRPIKGRLLDEFARGVRQPTAKTRDFLKRFNRHHYAIIGIESVPAYENLDALIREPGVDGVFIGMHDLSVSLEAPEEWENPECWRIVEDTIVRCRVAGIGVGLHLHPAFASIERAQRLISLGMNWVLDAADVIHTVKSLEHRREALVPASVESQPVEQDHVASCIATQPSRPEPVGA